MVAHAHCTYIYTAATRAASRESKYPFVISHHVCRNCFPALPIPVFVADLGRDQTDKSLYFQDQQSVGPRVEATKYNINIISNIRHVVLGDGLSLACCVLCTVALEPRRRAYIGAHQSCLNAGARFTSFYRPAVYTLCAHWVALLL